MTVPPAIETSNSVHAAKRSVNSSVQVHYWPLSVMASVAMLVQIENGEEAMNVNFKSGVKGNRKYDTGNNRGIFWFICHTFRAVCDLSVFVH